jgi:two-component system chemotaxis response regulator CheB
MEHGNVAMLVDQPRINGHRPSVDVLFESIAGEFRGMGVAVLMTGMGDDGAVGLGAVRSAGGFTIAQSLDTCVVESMPRSAIDRGFAMRVVPLQNITSTLQSICATEPQTTLKAAATAAETIQRMDPEEATARRRTS